MHFYFAVYATRNRTPVEWRVKPIILNDANDVSENVLLIIHACELYFDAVQERRAMLDQRLAISIS